MRDGSIVLAALALVAAPVFGQERLAPYVPSPQPVVERMLEAAELKPYETVYDLGCGDGRILITAARSFKAKAVGVELNDKLVRETRDQVKKLGLENRVTVVQGDLMKADLKPADVVTVYLLTSANEELKPVFEKSLRNGARVVSHDFQIRGWKPERIETIQVSNRTHTIYVYLMPPEKD
ncbi:MAG TPA: class I SAM-dependent methyltransferase [Bryobacteraceae bacterium]